MVTLNSINFDHPSVGMLGIPKFMLISCMHKLFSMINVNFNDHQPARLYSGTGCPIKFISPGLHNSVVPGGYYAVGLEFTHLKQRFSHHPAAKGIGKSAEIKLVLPLIRSFFFENTFKKYDTRRDTYNDQRNNQYCVGAVFHFIYAVVNYRLLFQALCQNTTCPKTC